MTTMGKKIRHKQQNWLALLGPIPTMGAKDGLIRPTSPGVQKDSNQTPFYALILCKLATIEATYL
jgi:hypothetical protein